MLKCLLLLRISGVWRKCPSTSYQGYQQRTLEGHSNKEDEQKWADEKGEEKNALCLSSADQRWVRVHELVDSFLICFNSYPQDVRETFSACCDLSLPEKMKNKLLRPWAPYRYCRAVRRQNLHLISISLATVDIKSIHSLWHLVQSLTAS